MLRYREKSSIGLQAGTQRIWDSTTTALKMVTAPTPNTVQLQLQPQMDDRMNRARALAGRFLAIVVGRRFRYEACVGRSSEFGWALRASVYL